MNPHQIARNLIADHLAALTVDTWEIRAAGWTGDPGPVLRAVDDLCHHLDGILAPEPEPDTSGSVPNRDAETSAAREPHPRTPDTTEAAQAEFGPRWRVGRSWGVTVVEQPHDGPDRLAAVAQTPADAARIVAALNAAEERELDRIEASVRGDQPERGAPCQLPGAHGQPVCVRELGSVPCGDCPTPTARTRAPGTSHQKPDQAKQATEPPPAPEPSNSAAGWDPAAIRELIADLTAIRPAYQGPRSAAGQLEALLADGEQARAGRSGPASSGGLDLDAIEARANAATPGPWGAVWGERIARGVEITGPGSYRCIQDVAEIPDDRTDWDHDEAVDVDAESDAEFIAHARQDVPALVARVRQLEHEREELAEELTAALTANEKIHSLNLTHLKQRDEARDEAKRWCGEVVDLEAEVDRLRACAEAADNAAADAHHMAERHAAELRDARNDLLDVRGILSPSGRPPLVPDEVPMVPRVAPAVEWLTAELQQARAEAKRARAERDEACAELDTERRTAAADALRWAALHLGPRGAATVHRLATSVLAGEITVPTTTEEQ